MPPKSGHVLESQPLQAAKPEPVTLPEKCCGRCSHGRPMIDPGSLKSMVTCKASPPTVCLLATPQGVQMKSVWPVMDLVSDCDAFAPKLDS